MNEKSPGCAATPQAYRKLPVVIQALRWTGDNLRDVIAFTGRHPSADSWTWEYFEEVVRTKGLKIFTLEGQHMASVGDYIIRGVKGEHYPCKPDIFEATYEPAGAKPYTCGECGKEQECSDVLCAWAGPSHRVSAVAVGEEPKTCSDAREEQRGCFRAMRAERILRESRPGLPIEEFERYLRGEPSRVSPLTNNAAPQGNRDTGSSDVERRLSKPEDGGVASAPVQQRNGNVTPAVAAPIASSNPQAGEYGPCSCQDSGKCRYVNGGPACMNEEQSVPTSATGETPRADAALKSANPIRIREDFRQLERELAGEEAQTEMYKQRLREAHESMERYAAENGRLRSTVATGNRQPDNAGTSDRWEDPRDTGGGETEPRGPTIEELDLAPETQKLMVRLIDRPEVAAEKVKGEVKQLQAGVSALFDALNECGLHAAKLERERNRLRSATTGRKPWQSETEAQQPAAVQEAIRVVMQDFGEIPDRTSPDDFPDGYVLTRQEIVAGLLKVLDVARAEENERVATSISDDAKRLRGLESLIVRWSNLVYPQKEIQREARDIEKRRASAPDRRSDP